MWTGTGARMKLHNVPVMSRRGRPKHEKNLNDQNSNGPNRRKPKKRYANQGQKTEKHGTQNRNERQGIQVKVGKFSELLVKEKRRFRSFPFHPRKDHFKLPSTFRGRFVMILGVSPKFLDFASRIRKS